VLVRFLIPFALAAVVIVAAATAGHRAVSNKNVSQGTCVHSDRQLASAACGR
jgi:putative copper export protein